MSITNLAKGYENSANPAALGPPLSFFAALLVTTAAAGLAAAMLHPDSVLPLAVSALFLFASIAAVFGWRHRKALPQASLNYWDVAGALTLIGICAATLVEPEQMVRLVADPR